ncbi:hypothetical protein F1714_11970, partial [Streptococcus pneumoniae]
GVRVELLLGSMTPKEREGVIERLLSGEAQVAVGTHALIQEGVGFKDLGLAVVDDPGQAALSEPQPLPLPPGGCGWSSFWAP